MPVNPNRERRREAAKLIKQGDHKSAQTILQELIKASPRDAELWYLYSFASTDRERQIKSLEKVLSLAPDHEKAKARLAQLKGEMPVPPKVSATAKPASLSYSVLMAGGLLSLVVLVLIVGVVLKRNADSIAALPTATQPPATLVIVTRKPTDILPTEIVLTETPTATRRPTNTRVPTVTQTDIYVEPTATPIPNVPQIIATASTLANMPIANLTEFGGGTGRILYTEQFNGNTFHLINLHDGSTRALNLPPEIANASWVSDGRQLLVSRPADEKCRYIVRQFATPEGCVGFADPANGKMHMIDGVPLDSTVSLSPDRSLIAYVDMDQQIWVANTDGTNSRKVTSHTGGDYGDNYTASRPKWTPDGRFITYNYSPKHLDTTDVYMAALDGSSDEKILHDSVLVGWMPDGSGLLYLTEVLVGDSWEYHLMLSNADFTQAREITPAGLGAGGYSVSPDGRLIAYFAKGGIYVMNIEGTWSTMILENTLGRSITNLSWEPLPADPNATATPSPTITPTLPSPTPLSELDYGGGTGHILYYYHEFDPGSMNVYDLHDGSINKMPLPDGIVSAHWLSDGVQLMVFKDYQSDLCRYNPEGLATPEPCLGFMNAKSQNVTMIDGFPRASSPDMSPDMSQIAYIGTDSNLWISRIDGTNVRQLTFYDGDSQRASGPSWSPDGRSIAYTLSLQGNPDIHIIGSDGTNDRVVIQNSWRVDWSPDGSSLAYVLESSTSSDQEIYVANIDGTNPRQLTTLANKYERAAWNPYSPVWSPDGRYIAFNASDGLYVMNADGSNLKQLLETEYSREDVGKPSWEPLPVAAGATATPTSTMTPVLPTSTPLSLSDVGGGTGRILYPYWTSGSSGETPKFRMVDLHDGTNSELSLPEGIVRALWVSDGLQLLVNRELDDKCEGIDTQFVTATPQPCVGFITANSGVTTMIPDLGIASQASLSPDLSRIAYVAESPFRGLWIANIDGTNRQLIAEGNISNPTWSPDGRLIAYSRDSMVDYSPKSEIHLINPDGTGETDLTSGSMPSWSPDGTALVYVSGKDPIYKISIIDLSGDNQRDIFASDGEFNSGIGSPAWSPDGQLIAFIYKQALYTMKADGSDMRRVAESVGGRVGRPSWQPLPPSIALTPSPTPTATPTIPTSTPLSIEDAGGGTGAILVYEREENGQQTGSYKMFNLRDGSLSPLPLPAGVVGASWAQDGRHLFVVKRNTSAVCADSTSSDDNTVACIGLIDAQSMSTSLIPLPKDSRYFALSPDSSLIAYIAPDYSDTDQIWVMRVDGSDVRQVTTEGVNQGGLEWTPDGRLITYIAGGRFYASADDFNILGSSIYAIAPDGTGNHLVIQNASQPAWSPDGRVLAYVSREADDAVNHIYSINADGTNRRKLTTTEGSNLGDSQPVWSPDGRLIAFLRRGRYPDGDGIAQLYVMQADGSHQRMVLQGQRDYLLFNPSWQPQPAAAPIATYTPIPTATTRPPVIIPTAIPASGSTVGGGTGRILYSRLVPNDFVFHTFDLNTMTDSDAGFPAEIEWAQWMADGRRYRVTQGVKAVSCEPGAEPSSSVIPEYCLGMMNAETKEVRLFTEIPGVRSPDQSLIAYIGSEDRNSLNQVFVMNADGSNPRQLTHYEQSFVEPQGLAWSPDGRFIAYTVEIYNNQPTQIERVSLVGSDETVMIEDGSLPTWSPDGTLLAYLSGDPYNKYLFVANADGSNPRQLTVPENPNRSLLNVTSFAWSPDSKLIAFVAEDIGPNTLSVAHADGSGITLLVESEDEIRYAPSWQPLPSASDMVWPTATPVLTPTPLPTLSPLTYNPNDITVARGPGQVVARLYSAPDDRIGGGLGEFPLLGSGTLETNGQTISITLDSNSGSWSFEFYAPDLEVGKTFEVLNRLPFSEGKPGLDVTRPGQSCDGLYGEFTLDQVSPNVLISFKQYCARDTKRELSGILLFQPEQYP